MYEHSLYEKEHPQRRSTDNAIALGRITAVDSDRRLCNVITFNSPDNVNDHSINGCQWLATDGHPDGDESGAIPRIGSLCMVFYIRGEPYVWGFFSPLTDDGSAVNPGKEKEFLFEGDRVFKTPFGNKIILRSHGEIQIECEGICKSIYFPATGGKPALLRTLLQDYEFANTGGTIDWYEEDVDNRTTYYRAEYRDDFFRSNIFTEEYGTIDAEEDPELIYRKELGKGEEGSDWGKIDTVWTQEIKNTGETTDFIRSPNEDYGYKRNVKPSGETTVTIGPDDNVYVNIKPTGEVQVNIVKSNFDLNVKPDGTTSLNIGPDKVKLKMTASGETTLDSTGAKLKMANKKIEFGQDSIQLLSKIIEELGNIITFITQAKDHIHEGNLGYQTLIPTDQTPWEKMIESTEKVKADMTTLKGNL